MILKQIDKAEFERLVNCVETYFCNGVIFDSVMDNVIAFPVYRNAIDIPFCYYEVQNDFN